MIQLRTDKLTTNQKPESAKTNSSTGERENSHLCKLLLTFTLYDLRFTNAYVYK